MLLTVIMVTLLLPFDGVSIRGGGGVTDTGNHPDHDSGETSDQVTRKRCVSCSYKYNNNIDITTQPAGIGKRNLMLTYYSPDGRQIQESKK